MVKISDYMKVLGCTAIVVLSTTASSYSLSLPHTTYVHYPDAGDFYVEGPSTEKEGVRSDTTELQGPSRQVLFSFPPPPPGFSVVLPYNLGQDANGVREARRRNGGVFRIWGGQTDFGIGTPPYGSFEREELNKVTVILRHRSDTVGSGCT